MSHFEGRTNRITVFFHPGHGRNCAYIRRHTGVSTKATSLVKCKQKSHCSALQFSKSGNEYHLERLSECLNIFNRYTPAVLLLVLIGRVIPFPSIV
jgi:hypothetical protein